MGFSSGYSTRTHRGGKHYNNEMTAHVWNAQSEERGQSSNGNLYFQGATLYSYGAHFVVGFIMPDGVALLNADNYSISTSGHKSNAWCAIRNRRQASVIGLTALAGEGKLLPRLAYYLRKGGDKKAMQDDVRGALIDHAVALSSPISFDTDEFGEVGAYLAKLVGLPAVTWSKAKRDAAARNKREADAQVKADREDAERMALHLADMPARRWRGYLAKLGTEYSNHGFVSLAKTLRRARKLMMTAKTGKLATAGRLAIVRARLKQVVAEQGSFDAKRQGRLDRNRLGVELAKLRNYRDASEEGKAALGRHDMANLQRSANYVVEHGRTSRLKASALTFAIEASNRVEQLAALEEARWEAERINAARDHAERVALWLAGEPVGRIRFDAETGGAALRVVGDTLETSHGAEVPLAHAVKAFRFIKMCRETGESFHRNGRTIRVGPFQVDSISSNGDFVAGCHNFTWPEVERVAKLAGVFDCPASADAVEVTSN